VLHPLAFLLLLFTCGACSTTRPPATAALLEQPGTVLFLGDSITYAGGYAADFEACWRASYPESSAEFVQLGLPSETVSGLSEDGHAGGAFPRPALDQRLGRTLAAIRPQLVFACYGMNDGIYQPPDPARFAAFRTGIEGLEQACAANGARLVLLTPPTFDGTQGKPTFAGYDDVLTSYATWLCLHGREVVDLHTAMQDFVVERRKAEPAFTLAPDGVHPDRLGHWLMARALLGHFGVAGARQASSCEQFLASLHAGSDLRRHVGERQILLRDAWLTTIGHQRPGLPQGQPMAAARELAAASAKAAQLQLPGRVAGN